MRLAHVQLTVGIHHCAYGSFCRNTIHCAVAIMAPPTAAVPIKKNRLSFDNWMFKRYIVLKASAMPKLFAMAHQAIVERVRYWR